jgi:hypothetical protein
VVVPKPATLPKRAAFQTLRARAIPRIQRLGFRELDVVSMVWHCLSDMTKTQISTRRFTKEFRTVRTRPLEVTDRGVVLGTWTPAPSKSGPVDFEERARKDSTAAMPVSFAPILKERKKP